MNAPAQKNNNANKSMITKIIGFVACIAIAGGTYLWVQHRGPTVPNPLADVTQRITGQGSRSSSYTFDDIYTQWHTNLTNSIADAATIMNDPYTSKLTMDITADYDANKATDTILSDAITSQIGNVENASLTVMLTGDSLIDKNFYTQSNNTIALDGSRSLDGTKDNADGSYAFNIITTTGDTLYVKLNNLAVTPPQALAQYKVQTMGVIGMINGAIANQWIELPLDQLMESTGNTENIVLPFGKEMITIQRDMYQYIATLTKKHDTPLLNATRVGKKNPAVYHLTIDTDATMTLLDEIMSDTDSPLRRYMTFVTTGMDDAPTPADLQSAYQKNKDEIKNVLSVFFDESKDGMNPLILTIMGKNHYTISTTQSDDTPGEEFSFSRSHAVQQKQQNTHSDGTFTVTFSSDDAPYTTIVEYKNTQIPEKGKRMSQHQGDVTVSIHNGASNNAPLLRKPSTLTYSVATRNKKNNVSTLDATITDPSGLTVRGTTYTASGPTKDTVDVPTEVVTFDELFGQFLNNAGDLPAPSADDEATKTPDTQYAANPDEANEEEPAADNEDTQTSTENTTTTGTATSNTTSSE